MSLFQQPLENIKAHSQLLSEAGVCSPQARPLRRPPLCIAGQASNALARSHGGSPVPAPRAGTGALRRLRKLPPPSPQLCRTKNPSPASLRGGGRDSAQHLLAGDSLKRLPVQVRWRRFRAQDPGTQLRSHVLSTGHTQTPQPQLWRESPPVTDTFTGRAVDGRPRAGPQAAARKGEA